MENFAAPPIFLINYQQYFEWHIKPIAANLKWNFVFMQLICRESVLIYCDMPGSPCLSKKGESNMRFVTFKIFCLGRSLAPCLVAARAVCWRPRLAGTQYCVTQNIFSRHSVFYIICLACLLHSQKEKLKLCMFSTYIEIFMFCTLRQFLHIQ